MTIILSNRPVYEIAEDDFGNTKSERMVGFEPDVIRFYDRVSDGDA